MATKVSMQAVRIRVRAELYDALAVLAQRAQALTNASGTAIALNEGNAGEIICRARAGSSAPEVGTALPVDETFTGLCIRSGKELRCDDAETDTRVDKAAIRALGIRSMVVVPIKEEGQVVGVLAVFAPDPHAFTITHEFVLKAVAGQIADYLHSTLSNEAYSPQPLPRPPEKAAAVSAAASPVLPPPFAIEPALTHRKRRVVPKVEPVRASTFAKEIPPAPSDTNRHDEQKESTTEKKLHHGDTEAWRTRRTSGLPPSVVLWLRHVTMITTFRREFGSLFRRAFSPLFWREFGSLFRRVFGPLSRRAFGLFDAAAVPADRRDAKVLLIGAATMVLTAVAVGLQYELRRPAAAPQPALEARSSPGTPAAPTPASTSAHLLSLSPAKDTPPAPPAKHDEAQPKREEIVELPAGPSRISLPQPANSAGATDNSAPASEEPAISLDSVPASGSLSNLASAGSQPANPRLSPDMEPVTAIKKVAPVYPLVAKLRRLRGSIVVQVTVDKNGGIRDLQLISGSPRFRDAAFAAVKQWVFKPARLNGQAIEQSTTIQLDFGAQ